jgi:hypothetical protein
MEKPIPIAGLGHKTRGSCKHGADVPGKIIEGCELWLIDGIPVALKWHKVRSECGCIGEIKTGSKISTVDCPVKRPVARLEDEFDGDYTGVIVEGFPNRRTV